jgi:hypothetical protein
MVEWWESLSGQTVLILRAVPILCSSSSVFDNQGVA